MPNFADALSGIAPETGFTDDIRGVLTTAYDDDFASVNAYVVQLEQELAAVKDQLKDEQVINYQLMRNGVSLPGDGGEDDGSDGDDDGNDDDDDPQSIDELMKGKDED